MIAKTSADFDNDATVSYRTNLELDDVVEIPSKMFPTLLEFVRMWLSIILSKIEFGYDQCSCL